MHTAGSMLTSYASNTQSHCVCVCAGWEGLKKEQGVPLLLYPNLLLKYTFHWKTRENSQPLRSFLQRQSAPQISADYLSAPFNCPLITCIDIPQSHTKKHLTLSLSIAFWFQWLLVADISDLHTLCASNVPSEGTSFKFKTCRLNLGPHARGNGFALLSSKSLIRLLC